jgi:hypothetical protein
MKKENVKAEELSLEPNDVLRKTVDFFNLLKDGGVPYEAVSKLVTNRVARRNLANYLSLNCPKIKGEKQQQILTHAEDAEELLSPVQVLNRTMEFFKLMEEQEGVSWADFLSPLEKNSREEQFIEIFFTKLPEGGKNGQIAPVPSSDYALARAILGDNFITPEEIAIASGLSYGREVLRHFLETIPPEEVCKELLEDNYILMAGPPSPMSILGVHSCESQLFGADFLDDWKKLSHDQSFMHRDKVHAEWLMIHNGIREYSTWRVLPEQLRGLEEWEYLPNAAEVTWAQYIHLKVHGRWLLSNVYARTSSVDNSQYDLSDVLSLGENIDLIIHEGIDMGYRPDYIRVGNSAKENFINVLPSWWGTRDEMLGMMPARKRA